MQGTRNVEALLSRGLVSNSPAQMDAILSDLWYNANSAQANLSQLPLSHDVVARTSKFLSQVGDYSYSLAKSNKTKNLSTTDWSAMQRLYKTSVSVNQEISTVAQQASAGAFHWTEIQGGLNQQLTKGAASSADTSFRNLDAELHELPTMVYDGPFSDHIEKMVPQGLTGDDHPGSSQSIAGDFADLGGVKVQRTV